MVEADLLDETSLADAVKGCQYVVHTASPFVLKEPKDENELIKPAVMGTLSIMKAAAEYGVKRVVITSSTATIYRTKNKSQTHFTADDFTDEKNEIAYIKSKTLAEKAAWSFKAGLPIDK